MASRPAKRATELAAALAPVRGNRDLTAAESDLVYAGDAFRTVQDLKPRMLVRWKPLLQNRAPPGPFFVVELLPEPLYDKTMSHEQFAFGEPLDIVLGYLRPPMNEKGELLAGDPVFVTFVVDRRRIEPVD